MPKYLGIDGVRQLWSNVESKISSEIANADIGTNVDLSNYVSYADLSNYISVSSSDDLTWDHLSEDGLFTGNLSTFGAAIINAGWGWANYHDAYLPSNTTIVSAADIINIVDSDLNSGSEGTLYTPIIGLGAEILNNISFADDDITTFTDHLLSGIDIGSELPDDVLRTSNIVTNSENYNAQPDNINLIYETIGESPSTTNYYIRSYWQGGNDSSALLITSYNLQENISNYAETMLNNVSWYYVNDTFVNGMMVYGGGISWIESIYTSLTESASSNQKSDLLVAFSPDSWNTENGAYDRVFNFIDDTGTATSMSVSDVSNESNGTTLVIQNYSINDDGYIPYGITKAYIPEFGWTFDNNGNDLLYIVHPTPEEKDGDLVNPSYGIITEKNISTYLSKTQEEIYNILLSYNLITASQLPDAFSYLSNN